MTALKEYGKEDNRDDKASFNAQEQGAEFLDRQLEEQIQKAAVNHEDEIMAVMKEVKKLLNGWLDNEADGCIIKEVWNENDHPRDEEGKFSGTGGSGSKAGEEVRSYSSEI